MATKPKVGSNNFNQELARGRLAAEAIRRALMDMTEDPGPQTRAMLIAKAALHLSKIQAVLDEIDKIGREARQTKNEL